MIESRMLRTDKSPVNKTISEQQAINCINPDVSYHGLWPWTLADFYSKNRLIPTDKAMRYNGKKLECGKKLPQAHHFVYYRYNLLCQIDQNEHMMKRMLNAYGPFLVIVDISSGPKRGAESKFEDDYCRNERSARGHSMLLIGYGHDDVANRDYWLLVSRPPKYDRTPPMHATN